MAEKRPLIFYYRADPAPDAVDSTTLRRVAEVITLEGAGNRRARPADADWVAGAESLDSPRVGGGATLNSRRLP